MCRFVASLWQHSASAAQPPWPPHHAGPLHSDDPFTVGWDLLQHRRR
jgi:hypothetical protein